MATAVATSHTSVFLEQVHRADDRVLLLDYDGTIAPFSADRDHVVPYSEVAALVQRLMKTCNTRVVLISGRPVRQFRSLAGFDPYPEIWGSHGLERLRPDGDLYQANIDSHVAEILNQAFAWLEAEGLAPLSEMKHGAVAVHWRGMSQREAQEARSCAYRVLSAFTGISDLSLSEFDCGLELRARRESKGDAVRTVLSEIGDEVPVAYLGDDLTDEYAFRALHGRGLTVLVRPTYRFTAAQVWIRPPEELSEFLTNWIRACGGDV